MARYSFSLFTQNLVFMRVLNKIYNRAEVIIVGGYTDHVHILCKLSKKIALMKLVEEVKSHSFKWIRLFHISLINTHTIVKNFPTRIHCIFKKVQGSV
jgi:REP element-mobilizing transposase RayT